MTDRKATKDVAAIACTSWYLKQPDSGCGQSKVVTSCEAGENCHWESVFHLAESGMVQEPNETAHLPAAQGLGPIAEPDWGTDGIW